MEQKTKDVDIKSLIGQEVELWFANYGEPTSAIFKVTALKLMPVKEKNKEWFSTGSHNQFGNKYFLTKQELLFGMIDNLNRSIEHHRSNIVRIQEQVALLTTQLEELSNKEPQ